MARKFGMLGIGLMVLLFGFSNSGYSGEAGLVGCWNFDEGSGNVAFDKSGNKNDGKVHGAQYVKYESGYALKFDGVDDYVQIEKKPDLCITDALTIEVWMKPESDNYNWIIGCGGENYGYYLAIWKGRTLKFQWGQSGEKQGKTYDLVYSPNGAVFLNTWQFVALTFNKGAVTLYLNGKVFKNIFMGKNNIHGASGPSAVSSINSNASVQIGSYLTSNYFFKGIIDKVSIYNRALSEEEIKTHYREGKM